MKLCAIALAALLTGCSTAHFPGTKTPKNANWIQNRRDTEIEYTVLRQILIAADRQKDPKFYADIAASAKTLEWYYRTAFGTDIAIVETIPAAIAPLAPQ